MELADGNEEDQDTKSDQLLKLLEMVDDEEGLQSSEEGKLSASGISTTVQERGKTKLFPPLLPDGNGHGWMMA